MTTVLKIPQSYTNDFRESEIDHMCRPKQFTFIAHGGLTESRYVAFKVHLHKFFAVLLALRQSASQFARRSDPARDLLSAPVGDATVLELQVVKSFGGIIRRIDELGATHPASLVV